jgi:hypothetical protein
MIAVPCITIFVAIMVLVFFMNARSHRRRREYFLTRQTMEVFDWAIRYFPECDESRRRIVCELAQVIASSIGCHATQILPSDSTDDRLLLPRIAFMAREDESEDWWDAICRMASQYNLPDGADSTRVLHADSWRTFGDMAREVAECFSRPPL